MSMMVSATELQGADLAARVRGRVAAGAPVREIEYMDMPLWLFAEMDHSRAVETIFRTQNAALVIHRDGSRMLRRAPSAP